MKIPCLLLMLALSSQVVAKEKTAKDWLDGVNQAMSSPIRIEMQQDGIRIKMVSGKMEKDVPFTRVDIDSPMKISTFQIGSRELLWYVDKNLLIDKTIVNKAMKLDLLKSIDLVKSSEIASEPEMTEEKYDGKMCVCVKQHKPAKQIEVMYEQISKRPGGATRDDVASATLFYIDISNGKLVAQMDVNSKGVRKSLTTYSVFEPIQKFDASEYMPPNGMEAISPKSIGELVELMSSVAK